MMKKAIVAVCVGCVLFLLQLPAACLADALMAGTGYGTDPGEPEYEEYRVPLFVSYEGLDTWRFTYTNVIYAHEDNEDYQITTQFAGVESIWKGEVASTFSLIGAVGPGVFQAESKAEKVKSARAVGILATGSIRIKIAAGMFAGVQYAYRNVAVNLSGDIIHGGYDGFQGVFGIEF